MDPYLEGSLWSTLHIALAMQIVTALAPRRQPEYLVLPQERLVTDSSGDVDVLASSIYPGLSRVDPHRSRAAERDAAPAGGVALAPLRLPTVVPVRIPHVSIEIRDRASRELVAAIEILSPTNKRADGAEEYLLKRRHVLMSQAHLVEIDLLRKGRRVPIIGELPAKPYFVFVNRRDIRPMCDIWPIGMDDPFPVVPVPLRPGEDDALLDPQAAFAAVYDLLRYDLAIDYAREPDVPLDEPDAMWARGILGRRFGRV
jgi:hypothetical protein